MAFMKLLGMLVVFMMIVGIAPDVKAAIDCNSIGAKLVTCINYVQNGGDISKPCCDGVAAVRNAAVTAPDRQQTCRCLQQVASQLPGIKPDNAATLPDKCGVQIPFAISGSTDCSKVK
ncbi:hypothetical protein K2173_009842 [Erythroxylum novogranatense]|uniref:Non-specific lipid-transfer protein n=1 Tax=Erythroxylum novogranatense TaxID=1862640 RepID=A0AAV8SZ24_9ROSI|nr:hypothetical protein K2173_009842 [Erythroxylum novogranatense]